MAWYRRSRFVYDSFKKLLTKTLIQSPATRLGSNSTSSSLSSFYNQYKSSGVFGTPSISAKLRNLNGVKQFQTSLFSAVARRYYHVDRNRVYHFEPRGFKAWFENPGHIFIVGVVSYGVVFTVYYGKSEVVPYTKRKHVVLLSRTLQRQIGDDQFQKIKKEFKGKILPAVHPDSVRVTLISKDVTEALQRGISHERVWSDPGYASEGVNNNKIDGEETFKVLSEGNEEKVPGDWRKEEEVLDDKWVKESRKKGEKHGTKPTTTHLEGMKWEVVVVDDSLVNAFCLPGGKIVVFTGLIKHFNSDAELATIIGHEVGHAVARHSAEQITKGLWFGILQLILYQFITPDFVNTMSNLLLKLPFSRKSLLIMDYPYAKSREKTEGGSNVLGNIHFEDSAQTKTPLAIKQELLEALSINVSQLSIVLLVTDKSKMVKEIIGRVNLNVKLCLENRKKLLLFNLSSLDILSMIQHEGMVQSKKSIRLPHFSSVRSSSDSSWLNNEDSSAMVSQAEKIYVSSKDVSYSSLLASESSLTNGSVSPVVQSNESKRNYILEHLAIAISAEMPFSRDESSPSCLTQGWVGSGSVSGLNLTISLSELQVLFDTIESLSEVSGKVMINDLEERSWMLHQHESEKDLEAALPDGAIVAIQDVHQHLYVTVESGKNNYKLGGTIHYSLAGKRALFRKANK